MQCIRLWSLQYWSTHQLEQLNLTLYVPMHYIYLHWMLSSQAIPIVYIDQPDGLIPLHIYTLITLFHIFHLHIHPSLATWNIVAYMHQPAALQQLDLSLFVLYILYTSGLHLSLLCQGMHWSSQLHYNSGWPRWSCPLADLRMSLLHSCAVIFPLCISCNIHTCTDVYISVPTSAYTNIGTNIAIICITYVHETKYSVFVLC